MTTRNALSALVAVLALAAVVSSQQPPASRPASMRVASAPASAGTWLTSYDEAKRQAAASGRLILVDFTGSDWCVWCKRLKGEVFDTPQFKTWASRRVVLLELDFPRQTPQDKALRAQNEELAKRYKIEGYPTVLFLRPDGVVAGQSGYMQGGPDAWIARADEFITEAKVPASQACP